jgi:homoserine dehydrogenase
VIGGPGLAESTHANLAMLPVSVISTRYHVTLEVADEPGVLASIANVFAQHRVSVEMVEQGIFGPGPGTSTKGHTATLVIGTHQARESDLAATVADLAELKAVTTVTSVLRIEGA